MTNKNCMSYWLPLLETTGVKTPKTILVHTDIDFIDYVTTLSPEGDSFFSKRAYERAH